MSAPIKWTILGLVLAGAVVGIVVTTRGGGEPAAESAAAAPAGSAAAPVAPASMPDIPTTARVPLTARAIPPATAATPVLALGWAFDFPWPPLAENKPSRDGVRFLSESGVSVFAHPLLQAVDWNSQFLDAGDDARGWLKDLEKTSPYNFYEAVLSITGQAWGNMSQERFKLAVAVKDALCPSGVTAITAFAVGKQVRGFQLGDPAAKRVAIYVVPEKGSGVVLDLSTRAGGLFTQPELDRLLGSLHPAPPTPPPTK